MKLSERLILNEPDSELWTGRKFYSSDQKFYFLIFMEGDIQYIGIYPNLPEKPIYCLEFSEDDSIDRMIDGIVSGDLSEVLLGVLGSVRIVRIR